MKLTKQFINVAGVLVVVIVIVAGVALIALPLFSQMQTTDASRRTVEQSNAVYQTQIDALSAADAQIAETDASLAQFRAQIPPFTKLDDAFEIIVAGAAANALSLEEVTASDPESFAPRVELDENGEPVAAEESASGSGAAAAGESADSAEPEQGPAPAPTATPEDAALPQQQIRITIKVPVPDAKTAVAFLDSLRVGPRLLLPINAKLEDGVLEASVLTFIRTDDTTAPSTTEVAP